MGRDMIEQVVQAITEAGRKLVANPLTVLTALLLYGLLIGAVFLFLTTRESSPWQVVLGLVVAPLLVVFLFFLLQAFGLTATRFGVGVGYKLQRAVGDCSRIILITLPLLLILFGALSGLERGEFWLLGRLEELADDGGREERLLAALQWLRLLLVGVVFPLWAIHAWIVAVREGAGRAWRSTGRILRQAFHPGSVLIYLLTTGLGGGLAWLIFRQRLAVEREWLELALFGVRIAFGLVVVFGGWLLTVAALGEWTAQRELNE